MKLFNIGEADNSPSSVRLSTEIISVQPNDYIIPVLTDIFQNIIDANDAHQPRDSKIFFTKKPFKNHYKQLDAAIYDRFGIKVKHISAIGCGYGVMTNPPNNNNVLNKELVDIYPEIATALKAVNIRDVDVTSPEDITDHNDVVNIYSNWKKSIDSLEDKLNTSGVVIDLQKARITGLPKDYHVFIVSDPKELIETGKLTALELVAVLMHEIGHLFTHIEYSYRTVDSTSVLIDSMHENIVKKGKGFKESIKLTYRELGGKDNLDKTNTVTATIKTLNRYSHRTKGMTNNNHSYTDSEQLADQFASRFGLTSELASAMDKVLSNTGLKIYTYEFMSTAFSLMAMIMVFSVVLTGSIMGGFVFIGGTTAYIIVSSAIMSIIGTLFTQGHSNDDNTYDDSKRRYQRMRNEIVRQLRTIDFDKKLIKTMLSEIESVDKLVKSAKGEADSTSMADKLYRMFSSNAKTNVNLKEMEQLIEDLQENDLHVSSNKLKTLV